MSALPLLSIDHLVIRPVRAEDLPALEWDGVYIGYRHVFRETFEDAQRGRRIMLVALAEGEMVGQVFVQLSSSDLHFADGATRGYLYALRVRPVWRGRGVGTRLIAAAEAALRERGFTTAVIAAAKENAGALRLYEQLGYRIFAEDPGTWSFMDADGKEQSIAELCWVLEKRLE
jgi:ribosomal protein S18 acetylase RimI-like enzyme